MPSSHLILCCPLFLLPPIPSNESTLRMRWPKYWSFSFSIIPSKEIPGLISFRMDWLNLLAVQGTLKSLLQQHSSKVSILRHSAFFTVQLSHPYMTTVKTIALTRRTFVGKVMSLIFNMLSRLAITFLPKSKRLLYSFVFFLSFPSLQDRELPESRDSSYFFTLWYPHGVEFTAGTQQMCVQLLKPAGRLSAAYLLPGLLSENSNGFQKFLIS